MRSTPERERRDDGPPASACNRRLPVPRVTSPAPRPEAEVGPPRRRASDALVAAGPALAFLATLLFQLPFFDRWFSAMDEGHMLQYADLVANGGQIYRDATSYPLPGAFYLLAVVFELFEPSIRLARWIVALEFAAYVAIFFVLLRRLVPARWAAAGVFLLWLYRVWCFPHWQMYNYSTTTLLLLVASLLLLVRFLESGATRLLVWVGLVTGLGVFCKQDYGGQALLAQIATLAVYARTAPAERGVRFGPLALRLVGGAAAIGLAAAAYFTYEGILSDVIEMTVLNYFRARANFELSSFPPPWPLFVQDPYLRGAEGISTMAPSILLTAAWPSVSQSWIYQKTAIYDTGIRLFLYAPHLLVLFGLGRAWWRRAALREPVTRPGALAEVALLLFASFMVFHISIYRPQDWVHLAVLYAPLPCLALVYAHALRAARPRVALALGALLLLPALVFTVWSGSLLWRLRVVHSDPIPSARAGILVKPAEAVMLGEIVDWIHANSTPDQTVAIMPYFPILHFLAHRDAPQSASYIVWPFAEWPDRDERIIRGMEETAAPIVVYNFTQFLALPPAEDFAPVLFAYLVEHYEMERVFHSDRFGYKLAGLRRTVGGPEGQPIIEPGAANARVFTQPTRGPLRQLEGRERDETATTATWPFRPVLALRPATDGRNVVAVPVRVPAGGARLETAIGLHPSLWVHWPPFPASFTIEVRRGDGSGEVLLARDLSPHMNVEDRGWHALSLSLDSWSGEEIELWFTTAVGDRGGESLRATGFGEPRIVARGAPR